MLRIAYFNAYFNAYSKVPNWKTRRDSENYYSSPLVSPKIP